MSGDFSQRGDRAEMGFGSPTSMATFNALTPREPRGIGAMGRGKGSLTKTQPAPFVAPPVVPDGQIAPQTPVGAATLASTRRRDNEVMTGTKKLLGQ